MRMIEELFPSYIMPLFTSQTMLLRGRALDIITSYGEKIKNQNILKGCKDFVMKSLKDEKNFIRLKAAKAVRIISECELLPPLRDN